jgi:hypothetical protein
MKIHSLTYVGFYDDDSFRVVTKVALSYKEACQIRTEMLRDHGQPVDTKGDEADWIYELEDGDLLHEETHDFPEINLADNLAGSIRRAMAEGNIQEAIDLYSKKGGDDNENISASQKVI